MMHGLPWGWPHTRRATWKGRERPGWRSMPSALRTLRCEPISACWNVQVTASVTLSGIVGTALLLACGGSAADHESLGDRDYVSRQFGDALVEYRIAIKQHSTARLRAKAGTGAP